jgi:hypothetical protein
MNCPHCGHKIEASEKKIKANRENASKPPKPGSRPRGWPKGKPRKAKAPE